MVIFFAKGLILVRVQFSHLGVKFKNLRDDAISVDRRNRKLFAATVLMQS